MKVFWQVCESIRDVLRNIEAQTYSCWVSKVVCVLIFLTVVVVLRLGGECGDLARSPHPVNEEGFKRASGSAADSTFLTQVPRL